MVANRQKAAIWIAVGAGIAVLLAANLHLVYVATSSQPECVAHARPGEGNSQQFSAAKSSCSPG
ncbi:MAG TPA: hypothetical protein PL193_11195 [Xanthobacteraceae bacterium]|nr:hypothetical protein [Xanthobacteraceae bacterium]